MHDDNKMSIDLALLVHIYFGDHDIFNVTGEFWKNIFSYECESTELLLLFLVECVLRNKAFLSFTVLFVVHVLLCEWKSVCVYASVHILKTAASCNFVMQSEQTLIQTKDSLLQRWSVVVAYMVG